MMKRLRMLLLALAVMASGIVTAQSYVLVWIWHTDGNYSSLNISDDAVIKLSGEGLSVRNADSQVIFQTDDATQITFREIEEPTGVEKLSANPDFVMEGDELVFPNISSPLDVNVWQVNGMPVNVKLENKGSCYSISLSSLPQGIYILKYKDRTIKFAKR